MLHSDWLRSTSYCISKSSRRTLVSKEWFHVKQTYLFTIRDMTKTRIDALNNLFVNLIETKITST